MQANGGKETAEQAAAFKLLEDRAASAAGKLAQAKINSQIDFGRQAALLSDSDVSIARRLSEKFGNDVPAAMASSEAAALRFNDSLHQVSSSIDNNLVTGLTDIISGTKSVSQGFSDMAASILRDIEKVIIKTAIVQPLMRGISSAFGGVAGSGFNPFAGLSGHADGGIISGPGGPRSDNILARLSPGEYVINAEAATRNKGLLDLINNGSFPRFADGGAVGMIYPEAPSRARGGGNSIHFGYINIQVPEGTSPTDASAIGNAVRSSMVQVVDDRIRFTPARAEA